MRTNNTRTTTWNHLGTDVTKCNTMEQVLKTSGLNYNVVKNPVYFEEPNSGKKILIPNQFATVRENDNHPYGVVSGKYGIIQNEDAFSFVDYMGKDLQFLKAGETKGGMVFIIAKLPEVKVLGDKFTPHVIFRNGFNGSVKITAAICPLRIVCQNQFNFAFKNTENAITIRHTTNAKQRLEEAKEVLKLSADYMQELNLMAEEYAGIKMTKRNVERFLDLAFPMDGFDELSNCKQERLLESRTRFINAYNADDNGNFKGTAWGLINAYTDFITHKELRGKEDIKEERYFIKTTFKNPMNNVLSLIDKSRVAA